MSRNIRSLFKQLVASSPVNYDGNLKMVVDAFVDDLSQYETGPATGCFNKILQGGYFSGSANDARRARCVAHVLYRFSTKIHPTKSDHKQHPVGWKALNKDARGWCVEMLTREIPTGLSSPAIDDVLTAKWLVTKIMRDSGLLPTHAAAVSPQRDPLHSITPIDVLDDQVDE